MTNEDLLTEEELAAFRLGTQMHLAVRGKVDAMVHDSILCTFDVDENVYLISLDTVRLVRSTTWTVVINQHEGQAIEVPMRSGEGIMATRWAVLRVVDQRQKASALRASMLMQRLMASPGLRMVLISSQKEGALQPGDIVTVTQF